MPDLLIKTDGIPIGQGIEHIPPVEADVTAAGRTVDPCLGMVRPGEQAVIPIGKSIVVLRTGTETAGKSIPVNKYLLISFTPPDVGGI